MEPNLKTFPKTTDYKEWAEYCWAMEAWKEAFEKKLREMLGSFENDRWKSGSQFYRGREARRILKELLGE